MAASARSSQGRNSSSAISKRPAWAQAIGQVLPLTHFLRVVRGIMLKGNELPDVIGHVWPIALFTVVALVIGVRRYRRTLD